MSWTRWGKLRQQDRQMQQDRIATLPAMRPFGATGARTSDATGRERRRNEIAAAARRAAMRSGEAAAERLARQVERRESEPRLDDDSIDGIPTALGLGVP